MSKIKDIRALLIGENNVLEEIKSLIEIEKKKIDDLKLKYLIY